MAYPKNNWFNDITDLLYGNSSGHNGTAVQGQTTTGSAAIATTQSSDPYANIFNNGYGASLTPAQLQQMLSSMTIGLTSEEKEELDRLTIEHGHEIKKQKLNAFKKINPALRQFVINAITWRESLTEINSVHVDKSQRLQELEQKRQQHNWYTSAGGSFHQQSGKSSLWTPSFDPSHMDGMLRMVGIPEGITIQDLMEAHVEATLEEEMLNGEEEV